MVAGVVVALMLAACSWQGQAAQTTATSAAINCGQATAVVSEGGLRGIRVGQIVVVTGHDASGRAVIQDFKAGSPTKVLIQPVEPLTSALRLEGWRCSTGERLRLQYGGGAAAVVAALPPAGDGPNGAPVGYSGYMLFTSPGEWMLAVSSKNGHLIGRAVVTVTAA